MVRRVLEGAACCVASSGYVCQVHNLTRRPGSAPQFVHSRGKTPPKRHLPAPTSQPAKQMKSVVR